MEKSVKHSHTLQGFLLGYLVRTGLVCAAVTLLWLTLLMGLISAGFVLPAYVGSDATLQAMERLPSLSADHFDADALPPLCRWVLLDGAVAPGGQAQPWDVLATNMNERQLVWALTLESPPVYHQYYREVYLIDGTLCRLQYDFTTPYADPALRTLLPDFQISMLVLWLILLVAVVAVMTRRSARRLRQKTQQLTAGCRILAAGDLSAAMPGPTGLRELDEALTTMETLRRELASSLQTQWAMEQQRTQRLAALAHDLKTPLTILQGNAELLAEESLTASQQTAVEAILRGAQRAGQYLADLRTVCGTQVAPAEPERIALSHWLPEIAATAAALCDPHKIHFAMQPLPPEEVTLYARRRELTRAVENLLANSVRFTPAGGRLTLCCTVSPTSVLLAVEDTGPGFPEEILRSGGQMFLTGDIARGDGHQGLGLYFARTVAQAHGGQLLLRSTETGAYAALQLPRFPCSRP